MNSYKVFWRNDCENHPIGGLHCAKTAAKAKAAAFRYLEDCGHDDFFESVRCMRVELVNKWRVSDLFNTRDMAAFIRQRGLSFVRIGMKVNTCSGRGIVCGINSSMNLNICLDGEHRVKNFHPTWKIEYLENDKIIKSFKG